MNTASKFYYILAKEKYRSWRHRNRCICDLVAHVAKVRRYHDSRNSFAKHEDGRRRETGFLTKIYLSRNFWRKSYVSIHVSDQRTFREIENFQT